MRQIQEYVKVGLVFGLSLLFSGCVTRVVEQPAAETITIATAGSAPGVEQYIWEEPMVDVVEVPPGLDPEGIYYRPAHQEVIEIRQGRWKYYRGRE